MELKEIKDLLDGLVMGDLLKADVARELGFKKEDINSLLSDLIYDSNELYRRGEVEWNDKYDKLLEKYSKNLE